MSEDEKLVRRILAHADGMTPWEVDFMEEFTAHGTKIDLGDATSYALDGWLVIDSLPSAICRSKTR